MPDTMTVPDAETIRRTIKALVADVAGQEPGQIDDAAELEALGIDSLLIVEVVVGVQRRFGVQVPPSEFRGDIRTVGQVCEMLGGFVHARLAEMQAAALPVAG
jgi:acyl carrier protein